MGHLDAVRAPGLRLDGDQVIVIPSSPKFGEIGAAATLTFRACLPLPLDLSRHSIAEAIRVVAEREPTRLGSVDRGLRGDHRGAAASCAEALRLRETVGDVDSPAYGIMLSNLAWALLHLGDLDRAEATARRAHEMCVRHRGERSQPALQAMSHLGNALSLRGEHEEALALLRTALAIREETLPAQHAERLASMANLERCATLASERFGPDHWLAVEARAELARRRLGADRPRGPSA